MKKVIIIFITICMLAIGCSSQSKGEKHLPKGAKAIQDMGNGWVTFELGDMQFLYYKGYDKAYVGYQALTKIN